MNFSMLRHEKCGGNLQVDVTHLFTIRTPSISYTPKGIALGVVEIDLNRGAKGLAFFCEKCKERIIDNYDKVLATCMACQKSKNVSEIRTLPQISSICEECCEVLTEGYDGDIPAHLKYINSLVTIPKGAKPKKFKALISGEILI